MKKTIFIFFAIFFVLSPILVFGTETEVNYPAVPGPTGPVGPGTSFVTYAGYLFNLAIAIGGIIALVVIVWAGFIYLTSTTSPTKKEEAKRKILAALLGLIILLAAYAILATINPQLLILSLQEVIPTSTSPISGPATPTTTFTEIPLGTLIENILGKNISCFDKDRNLIDCQESGCFATTSGYICQGGIQFQGSATTTFASTYPKIATSSLIFVQDTDFRYCYTYDSDGNKKGLLEYKDQYECIRNLLPAMEIKAQKLKDMIGDENTSGTLAYLAKELKDLSRQLDAKAQELRDAASTLNNDAQNDCKCSNCSVSGDSSGCPDCSCVCAGPPSGCCCSGDPCKKRAEMECLRGEGSCTGGMKSIPQIINEITCNAPTCIIPKILAKEKEVHEKRDKVKAFIFGASTSTDFWYYATSMDPYATSTFLTFNEGRKRLKLFLEELKKDLDDLKKAEDLMKDPYGDRLTLIEFLALKKKDPRIVITPKFRKQYGRYGSGYVYMRPYIATATYDENDFVNFGENVEIDKYCWDFNCTGTTTQGVCDECATSTEGRMCKIDDGKEQFVYDGDPATFYYHPEYNEERVLTKEKCTIDKNKEEGFRLGEIPIGQTVDDAEDFAQAVIGQVENFYNEIKSIQDKAADSFNEAYNEIVAVQNQIEKITGRQYQTDISEATTTPHLALVATTTDYEIYYAEGDDQLIDLTSPGSDNTDDCVNSCPIVCSSVCDKCSDCGLCCDWGTCSSPGCTPPCIDYTDYCTCQTCTGTVCPWTDIQSAYDSVDSCYQSANGYYKEADTHSTNIATNHSRINTSINNLSAPRDKFINLIEAKISPHDISSNLTSSNRCTILHKLTNARRKLQKCFRGFSFSSKTGKVKKRVFSSKIGLDLYHGRKLVILPDDFFYKSSKIDAYPYNSDKLSSSQQSQCRANRVSTDCWNAIRDLLEDYYCCETVP